MGDHLWPCSRAGGCPDQQMGPHRHTLGSREGSVGSHPSRVSHSDAASPSAQALTAAPCSSPPVGPPSGTAYSQCCHDSLPLVGQEQHQLRSQRPCPDGTRAVTAGAARGPCSVWTTAPVRGRHAHMPAHADCAALCVTRGSRRVLVTGS